MDVFTSMMVSSYTDRPLKAMVADCMVWLLNDPMCSLVVDEVGAVRFLLKWCRNGDGALKEGAVRALAQLMPNECISKEVCALAGGSTLVVELLLKCLDWETAGCETQMLVMTCVSDLGDAMSDDEERQRLLQVVGAQPQGTIHGSVRVMHLRNVLKVVAREGRSTVCMNEQQVRWLLGLVHPLDHTLGDQGVALLVGLLHHHAVSSQDKGVRERIAAAIRDLVQLSNLVSVWPLVAVQVRDMAVRSASWPNCRPLTLDSLAPLLKLMPAEEAQDNISAGGKLLDDSDMLWGLLELVHRGLDAEGALVSVPQEVTDFVLGACHYNYYYPINNTTVQAKAVACLSVLVQKVPGILDSCLGSGLVEGLRSALDALAGTGCATAFQDCVIPLVKALSRHPDVLGQVLDDECMNALAKMLASPTVEVIPGLCEALGGVMAARPYQGAPIMIKLLDPLAPFIRMSRNEGKKEALDAILQLMWQVTRTLQPGCLTDKEAAARMVGVLSGVLSRGSSDGPSSPRFDGKRLTQVAFLVAEVAEKFILPCDEGIEAPLTLRRLLLLVPTSSTYGCWYVSFILRTLLCDIRADGSRLERVASGQVLTTLMRVVRNFLEAMPPPPAEDDVPVCQAQYHLCEQLNTAVEVFHQRGPPSAKQVIADNAVEMVKLCNRQTRYLREVQVRVGSEEVWARLAA